MSSNDWQKVKLSNVINFKNGRKKPDKDGDIPIYGGNGILGYTNNYNNEEVVVIGRVGAYCGSVYYEPGKCWISDNAISAQPLNENSVKYIYYALKSLKLNERRIGTGQPLLTQSILNNIDTIYPMPDEQKAIAATLSCLDAKIELNNSINRNLEAITKAIFKSWFMDFEPFQDGEFQDSKLGRIPKGWLVGRADDYFEIMIGKTPPRNELQWFSTCNSNMKWVSISDMGKGGVYILDTSEYLTKEAIKKHNVKIVPKNTVLLSFKLTVGRVAITSEEMTTNEAIAHFKTDKTNINEFLYYYLKNFNYDSLGNTSSIATAVNSKVIKAMQMIMPCEQALNDYHNIVYPLINAIRKNEEENQTLVIIRDSLLPKLMSGETKVPVEEVK